MSGGRGPQAAAPGGEVEDAAGGGAVAGGHQGLHRLHLLPHALHNHSLGIKSSQVLPILRVHVPSLKMSILIFLFIFCNTSSIPPELSMMSHPPIQGLLARRPRCPTTVSSARCLHRPRGRQSWCRAACCSWASR